MTIEGTKASEPRSHEDAPYGEHEARRTRRERVKAIDRTRREGAKVTKHEVREEPASRTSCFVTLGELRVFVVQILQLPECKGLN